jgi:hypothetical protein
VPAQAEAGTYQKPIAKTLRKNKKEEREKEREIVDSLSP